MKKRAPRRRAPNFGRLLRKNPQHLRITYKGITWRYWNCGHCWKHFWRETGERHLNANPIRSTYCSARCQQEARKINNRERADRYRQKQIEKKERKLKKRAAVESATGVAT